MANPIPSSGLVRSLSLLDVVMVGIAAMIGGAIFVLVGPAMNDAGPALIIVFLLNGIMTLFTAMTYAELGSALPEAGGGYSWIRMGLILQRYESFDHQCHLLCISYKFGQNRSFLL